MHLLLDPGLALLLLLLEAPGGSGSACWPPLYHFCYGQLIHSQPPSFRLPFANRLTFWPLPTSLLKSHRVASQMNVALGGTHCLHSLGGIMTLQGEDAPDHLLAVLRRGFSL